MYKGGIYLLLYWSGRGIHKFLGCGLKPYHMAIFSASCQTSCRSNISWVISTSFGNQVLFNITSHKLYAPDTLYHFNFPKSLSGLPPKIFLYCESQWSLEYISFLYLKKFLINFLGGFYHWSGDFGS